MFLAVHPSLVRQEEQAIFSQDHSKRLVLPCAEQLLELPIKLNSVIQVYMLWKNIKEAFSSSVLHILHEAEFLYTAFNYNRDELII